MIRLFAAPLRKDGHAEAYALLAAAYTRWTGAPAPPVLKTETGKPYFAGDFPACSLAHAKTLVVCALSDEGAVGVDAETIRPLHAGLERRILTQSEQQWLLTQPDRPVAILTLWTRKESWVKLTGQGLDGQPRAALADASDARFFTQQVRDCIVTLCTHAANAPPPVIEWLSAQ